MKRILLFLMIACSALTLNAKSWKIIGKALAADTTLLTQDASNTNIYRYIGKISNKSFKLFDGSNNYAPVCGMDDPFEQNVSMQKQTDVSQTGFCVKYVNPNDIYCITITDGAIPKILTEKVVPYNHLYFIGGPVSTNDPNWIIADARELERDKVTPFIFYYRGFLKYNPIGDEGGALKILTSKTNWDPAFHPAGNSNIPLKQATKMRLNGDDTKWEIPSDGSGNGYYVIKINTLEETITVEQFVHSNVDYPTSLYITGDAMPCGWVNTTPEIMLPTNIMVGKYSWTGNVLPGQFKFLKNKDSWNSCYVSTIENQSIDYGNHYPIAYEADYVNTGGNDFKFLLNEADRCIINVDLANMKMWVTKESQSSIENSKLDNGVIIVGYEGKIVMNSSSAFKKKYVVYAVDGRKVCSNSLVYHSEIPLPKGCYLVLVTEKEGQKCKKICI